MRLSGAMGLGQPELRTHALGKPRFVIISSSPLPISPSDNSALAPPASTASRKYTLQF